MSDKTFFVITATSLGIGIVLVACISLLGCLG